MLVEEQDLARLGSTVGNYKLDKILGRGGMGTVYAGEHVYIKKPVAVKVLHPQFARYPDAVNRFLHAAPGIPFSPSLGHSATTLSHPATTSHRYVSPAEKKRQGITDGLIRLSVGVEALPRIQKEMKKGLT